MSSDTFPTADAAAPERGHAERFRSRAETTVSMRDLGDLFTREMEPFGFTGYAVGHLQGGGRPVTMFMATWPRALMEIYAVNAFITDDPAVRRAVSSPAPFTWGDAGVGRGFAPNRVLAAFNRFGYEDGFVVPLHGRGEARGVVALLSRRVTLTPAARAVVVEMSRACYAVAQRLALRRAGPLTLPAREREALSLVARGFEDAAIGAAMGVTRTSAHVYVERAKRRLGATTRAQAVAIAVTEGVL